MWQENFPKIVTDQINTNRVDVIIVGAGLTGVSAAVLLARSGLKVRILEAQHVGSLTTGKTTGKLSLLQGDMFQQLRQNVPDEIFRAYIQSNQAAQQWLVEELHNRHEIIQERDVITFVETAADVDYLQEEFEAAVSVHLPVHSQTESDYPFPIPHSLMLPKQYQLHPMELLAYLVSELRNLGGEVIENCTVQETVETAAGVEIHTSLGNFMAEYCVIASGFPPGKTGKFFTKITPSRSFVGTYILQESTYPRDLYVSIGSSSYSLRSVTDSSQEKLVMVGGQSFVPGREATSSKVQELDDWVEGRFGKNTRKHLWAAQDYRSHSVLPFADLKDSASKKVFVCTAYNKWGMTNSVAAALSVHAQIMGKDVPWSQPLREFNRKNFHSLLDAAAANSAVAGKMISGWSSAELQTLPQEESIAEGEALVGQQGLKPVAVSRVDGKICRLSAVCPHMGGILRWNGEEKTWDCPLHGSRFESTGKRIEGPAVSDLEEAPSATKTDAGTD